MLSSPVQTTPARFFPSSRFRNRHNRPPIPRHHAACAPPFSCSLAGGGKTRADRFTDQPSDGGREAPKDSEAEQPAREAASAGSDVDGFPGDKEGVRGIHVPKQKYIPVSKADLLEAILSTFQSKEDADEFTRFSRCLDSVLHAEHKVILEEMRSYYSLIHYNESKRGMTRETLPTQKRFATDSITWKMGINGRRQNEIDKRLKNDSIRNTVDIYSENVNAMSDKAFRLALISKFQRTFMKLLRNAQFEEMSSQDLLLTRALNTDYLLTLPIYVDWKRALESNAIIFRRGYTTERQRGLLIVEKLDYLQSKLLQDIFLLLSKPSKRIVIWFNEVLEHSNQSKQLYEWVEKIKVWIKEECWLRRMQSYIGSRYNNQMEEDQSMDNDLPIWLAAQKAVPRYEGFLSSVGPRGRLMRKLLIWTGFIISMPGTPIELDKNEQAYSRSNFLSRITLSDIWKPATKEACGNNWWKMFKTSISIIFKQAVLQEPAFQELILLYSEDASQTEWVSKAESPLLNLKIYEKIPIPELPVIFPHKKLSFRILDTIRLDIASIVGLLAYFINYKFETINSSPSAFWLDVIAVGALIIYATRVGLGYKQTWDRYQLLVNRTLYEKTLASGFGSVHFLLDASEQQQQKEAILAYALLLHSYKYQISCRGSTKEACERFIYEKFGERVEMPIDSAVETLLRLEIATEVQSGKSLLLEATQCSKACEALKIHWDKLLEKKE